MNLFYIVFTISEYGMPLNFTPKCDIYGQIFSRSGFSSRHNVMLDMNMHIFEQRAPTRQLQFV